MTHGLEPYDGNALTHYLVTRHSATFLRQTGSHLYYELPDGRKVGSTDGPIVDTHLAHRVAEQLGIEYHALRRDIGHPISSRRPGRRRSRRPPPRQREAATKAAVLRLASDVRDLATAVDQENRCGQRDPAHYERVYTALAQARDEITHVLSKSTDGTAS